jgi:hypothetical protein
LFLVFISSSLFLSLLFRVPILCSAFWSLLSNSTFININTTSASMHIYGQALVLPALIYCTSRKHEISTHHTTPPQQIKSKSQCSSSSCRSFLLWNYLPFSMTIKHTEGTNSSKCFTTIYLYTQGSRRSLERHRENSHIYSMLGMSGTHELPR